MTSERKRKLWLAVGVLGVIAGVAVPRPAAAVSPPSTAPAVRVVAGVQQTIPSEFSERLRRAIATHDVLEWEPVIGELRNPIYNRDEAIAILTSLLDQPDGMVRVKAAQELLELGSQAGVSVLQSVLRAVGEGKDVAVMAVATAANALHNFRQEMDPSDLYACYQRYHEPLLLHLAALHEAPQVYALVREERAIGQANYQTDWLAAYLGMNDSDSLQQYAKRANAKGDYESQLLGHWALYQATGNAADLDYVIGTAREAAGLELRSERSQPWAGTAGMAFDLLKITVTPSATHALEEIADFAARKEDGDSNTFQRAFVALFYLHQDYDFVDQRVLAFMQGHYGSPPCYRHVNVENCRSETHAGGGSYCQDAQPNGL